MDLRKLKTLIDLLPPVLKGKQPDISEPGSVFRAGYPEYSAHRLSLKIQH